MIVASIFQVITGKVPLDITGPVGIVITIGEVARTGIVNLLWLTGLISISLGLVNLLPIPALDGGRLLFLLIEAVRGRPLDPEKEGLIHFIGFALLILLIDVYKRQDRGGALAIGRPGGKRAGRLQRICAHPGSPRGGENRGFGQ